MAKKDFKKEEQNLENVQEALNTTSAWIEANQNKLTWVITILVAVVLGVMALNTYVLKPQAVEASNENAKAVVYFTQGNYELALNGDEAECIGFEAIANEYKCSQVLSRHIRSTLLSDDDRNFIITADYDYYRLPIRTCIIFFNTFLSCHVSGLE